ncbi:MAG: hypothetical protein ACRDSK_08795, partial [Actinophytocola sp.]|uniref:hypothetical protein n=1 Tax=Actinophytocola sp. TaxID=1872138 RepID=UPI003D6AA2D0
MAADNFFAAQPQPVPVDQAAAADQAVFADQAAADQAFFAGQPAVLTGDLAAPTPAPPPAMPVSVP